MTIDVKFRIVREGASDSYPWESFKREYSINGIDWYNAYYSPFDSLFPHELMKQACDVKIKKGETKIFEL